MKREIINNLINWKNSKNRKPLIIHGARQVGKNFGFENNIKSVPLYAVFCI